MGAHALHLPPALAAAAASVRASWRRITRTLVAVLLPASLLYLGAGFAPPGSMFATKTYLSSMTWLLITVVVVSLPTVGKTAIKALERLLGSLLGGGLGLAFISTRSPVAQWAGLLLAAALGEAIICAFKKDYTGKLVPMTYIIVVGAGLEATDTPWLPAVERLGSVLAGIALTFIVSMVWFPQSSSSAAFSSLLTMTQHVSDMAQHTWDLMDERQQRQQSQRLQQQASQRQQSQRQQSQRQQSCVCVTVAEEGEGEDAAHPFRPLQQQSQQPQKQLQQKEPEDTSDASGLLDSYPCEASARLFMEARAGLKDAVIAAEAEHQIGWLCGRPVIVPKLPRCTASKSSSSSGGGGSSGLCRCLGRRGRPAAAQDGSSGSADADAAAVEAGGAAAGAAEERRAPNGGSDGDSTTFSNSSSTLSNNSSSNNKSGSSHSAPDLAAAAAAAPSDDPLAASHDGDFLPRPRVRAVSIALGHCVHVLWVLHRLLQDGPLTDPQQGLAATLHGSLYPPTMLADIRRDSLAVLQQAHACLALAVQRHTRRPPAGGSGCTPKKHAGAAGGAHQQQQQQAQEQLAVLLDYSSSLHASLDVWQQAFFQLSHLRREYLTQLQALTSSKRSAGGPGQQLSGGGTSTTSTVAAAAAAAAATAADDDGSDDNDAAAAGSGQAGHVSPALQRRSLSLFFLTPSTHDSYVFVLQWHALHYTLRQLDAAFTELAGSLTQLLAAMEPS